MKTSLLFSLLFLMITADLQAQFYGTQYRSPGQNWQQLQTEQFRVIFPERYRQEAERTLSILELEYRDIQGLVGGELRDFPVILNPENDRSNGFVSPFNFRSEIEIAPFLGKSLSPRSGDWLESVVPHELVHALHFSANPPSIVRPLGLFSPDARRSIHAAAPLGILEGVAVEHESHNTMPASGRGNYPYFNNQLYAMMGAGNPWSMGQLVHTTTYTPPFNRHYIGGYAFINWLRSNYGEDVIRRSINRHYQMPFFGFGFALRTTTGEWPGSLYSDFMADQRRQEAERLDDLDADTDALSESIPFRATCRRANRPLTLSNDDILFFGRSCNRTTGFYKHSSGSSNSRLFYEVTITGDNHYSLSPDGSSLIYSRYHTDSIYDNQFRADLHQLDLFDGTSRRITRNQRLASPSFSGGSLYATQTEGITRRLVTVDPETGEITRTYEMADHTSVTAVAPGDSRNGSIAILGKKHGVQAIWFKDPDSETVLFRDDPDIVFERASIFDPVWSPDGERLVFTADAGGVMNIYEYHAEQDEITQITDSRYSAFEGSYDPNEEIFTYIIQRENEQLPVRIGVLQLYDRQLDRSEWSVTAAVEHDLDRPLLNRQEDADRSDWQSSDYRTGFGWLRPRIWLPSIEQMNDPADRIGISLESADRMSRHAYSLEVSHFARAFWFDGTYRYTGRYPGFEIELYNRPSLSTFQISSDGETSLLSTIAQNRGATLSVPFRYRMEQNVRFSSFLIEPKFTVSQTRFTSPSDARQPLSDFGDPLYSAGLNTTLNYNLRQNTRDLQPNAGVQLFTQTRYGLNSVPFTLQLPGGTASSTFSQRKGFRAGVNIFAAPLQRFNQSLRLSAQVYTQTPAPVFDTQSVISNLFETLPAPGAPNLGIVGTRYTIPLIYPDDGGFLLPVYLSNIYLVLFSQTVADLNNTADSARTVLGSGIRTRFKIGNLQFDLGIAVGWEPGTGHVNYLVGDF
ncbi:hypothetical protein DYD21_00165 [Rhodohalobacter sp. SW132]|uniref:PD40 domain-containing protein n=1 Tax=Rhodohalobacter sp. SW132 TaxID=2293433 RepID=UPI000E23638B|nr:PD40 domain-containing protein [Rhodohalobacter sp. SW132]REL38406.1 hypothetical protein DYD21_00165 [Rhodohalobacter sp. SW132]